MRTLIDLDGVILNNHNPIHNKVAKRCISFTSSVLPELKNPQKIANINNTLYGKYGHTVIGLSHVFGATGKVTPEYCKLLPIFNKYVYKDLDPPSITFKENIEARAFFKAVPDAQIFSNAPDEWIERVGRVMDIDLRPVDKGGYLKPDPNVYRKLSNTNVRTLFIDDSMSNLAPIMYNPLWIKVFYLKENLENRENPIKIRDDLWVVSTLEQAAALRRRS
jgi:FMN phosphatase YigB (HAD superfamily)